MQEYIKKNCMKIYKKRFSSATVAICGLGGLGSNIAVALARAGVGKLILIDFDMVDITNLHRQQYKDTAQQSLVLGQTRSSIFLLQCTL